MLSLLFTKAYCIQNYGDKLWTHNQMRPPTTTERFMLSLSKHRLWNVTHHKWRMRERCRNVRGVSYQCYWSFMEFYYIMCEISGQVFLAFRLLSRALKSHVFLLYFPHASNTVPSLIYFCNFLMKHHITLLSWITERLIKGRKNIA